MRYTNNYAVNSVNRVGDENNIFRPIQSARIATAIEKDITHSFTFGTIEIRAKMPRGDWIAPGIYYLVCMLRKMMLIKSKKCFSIIYTKTKYV
jgi:hypothetical protein